MSVRSGPNPDDVLGCLMEGLKEQTATLCNNRFDAGIGRERCFAALDRFDRDLVESERAGGQPAFGGLLHTGTQGGHKGYYSHCTSNLIALLDSGLLVPGYDRHGHQTPLEDQRRNFYELALQRSIPSGYNDGRFIWFYKCDERGESGNAAFYEGALFFQFDKHERTRATHFWGSYFQVTDTFEEQKYPDRAPAREFDNRFAYLLKQADNSFRVSLDEDVPYHTTALSPYPVDLRSGALFRVEANANHPIWTTRRDLVDAYDIQVRRPRV